jgi:hypothetical protein
MFMFRAALSGIWGFVYFAGFSTRSPAIVALVIALAFIPHAHPLLLSPPIRAKPS